MKSTRLIFSLPLAALGLGGLLLTGCAAQTSAGNRAVGRKSAFFVSAVQPDSSETTSPIAVRKKVKRAAAPELQAEAEPPRVWKSAPEAAEQPAPEPQAPAAAEPAPKPKPQAAAEPVLKRRGPLTRADAIEIDNQVMP